MLRDMVPHYFLYGESSRRVDAGFCHVERVGDRGHLHGGHVIDHHHPHLHQLSYWLEPKVDYFADGDSHFLETSTLVWIPSGTVHGFSIRGSGDCIVVSLSDDFVHKALHSLGLPMVQRQLRKPAILTLPDELKDPLLGLFQRVEQEYRYPSWAQSALIEIWIKGIFLELVRLSGRHEPVASAGGKKPDLFARFLELLDRHFRDEHNVDRYCAMLGCSPYLLNRATASASSQRASEIIADRRMQEAKRLLLFTIMDISAIAFALGFSDPAHFGRMFRRQTGEAPGRWREDQRRTQARQQTGPDKDVALQGDGAKSPSRQDATLASAGNS